MMLRLFAWVLPVCATVWSAFAQTTATPPPSATPLTVQQDTVIVLDLNRPADQIHIANPDIADVSAVLSNRMVLMGKTPGQTNILVLDDAQRLILDQLILVVPPETFRVTLHRGIEEYGYSCAPRCVLVSGPDTAAPTAGGATGGSGDAPVLPEGTPEDALTLPTTLIIPRPPAN